MPSQTHPSLTARALLLLVGKGRSASRPDIPALHGSRFLPHVGAGSWLFVLPQRPPPRHLVLALLTTEDVVVNDGKAGSG